MKGIYKITNKINNKRYYGSSVDICGRWDTHISLLNNSKHGNQYLQNSWNKYEKDNFSFEIILLCEEFELEYYEQWFLDNVVKWGFDYNIAECAEAPMRGRFGKNHPMYGRKHLEESKRKISEAQRRNTYALGYVHTKEAKRKIKKATRGRKHLEESKRKMSVAHSGENCYNSKLIKERVVMIRRMHLTEKYTQEVLGKLFNTSRPNISDIVNYKTWKHIA